MACAAGLPGGTGSTPGGLSPQKNAARPAHPAGVPNSAASARAMAVRRLASLGSAIHVLVASSDAWMAGVGVSPWARRAQTQAHQTAGRRSSA
jgi:hypothetical protein